MSKRFLKKLILLFLALFLILGVSACLKKEEIIKTNTNEPEKQLEQTNIDKKQVEEANQGIIIPPTKTDCINELDTECWDTYRNEEYGYEIKYPKNWKMSRDSGYNEFVDSYYESNYFIDTQSNYYLSFGLVPEDSKIRIPNIRTGIGAGDLIRSNQILNISGVEVGFYNLVYEDKVKEIFFDNFKLNGFTGSAEFSYNGDLDYSEYDLSNSIELELSKNILKSLRLIK